MHVQSHGLLLPSDQEHAFRMVVLRFVCTVLDLDQHSAATSTACLIGCVTVCDGRWPVYSLFQISCRTGQKIVKFKQIGKKIVTIFLCVNKFIIKIDLKIYLIILII